MTTDSGNSRSFESTYSARDQGWTGQPGRPWSPGLVIHAHGDGGFSVWDPARNYWKRRGNIDVQDRLPGYVFSPQEVWTGLSAEIEGRGTRVCNGLLDDWSSWIREKGDNARRMSEVVGALAVRGEPWEVGPLLRLSVDDAQDIPSIRTDYSRAVPIVHASSAVRRIAGLAYMLVWAWSEHERAAEQLALRVTRQVILLFDEIDAHLHPRWQRTIVPAILGVMDRLTDSDSSVQLIGATHSPLVLASVEPHFDEERDRLFHLDFRDGRVRLDIVPWAPQGDALNWLVSDVFGLRQARSVEGPNAAIDAAQAYMRGDTLQCPEDLREPERIHEETPARAGRARSFLAALGRVDGTPGRRAMIRFERVPEPAEFAREARAPGEAWLAKYPGRQAPEGLLDVLQGTAGRWLPESVRLLGDVRAGGHGWTTS